MIERLWGNCLGCAYLQIGYSHDGQYPTSEVLRLFHEVPPETAELVAAVWGEKVEHVVAFNPTAPDTVTHREESGADIVPFVPFAQAIGYYEALDYTLVYLRRNDPQHPQEM